MINNVNVAGEAPPTLPKTPKEIYATDPFDLIQFKGADILKVLRKDMRTMVGHHRAMKCVAGLTVAAKFADAVIALRDQRAVASMSTEQIIQFRKDFYDDIIDDYQPTLHPDYGLYALEFIFNYGEDKHRVLLSIKYPKHFKLNAEAA